ncbi:MAG: hypothetical protein JXD23_00485 [Spirochaetales bacterium]|nr:hypothetical protein [Spirochaetales bacterium]
MRRHPSIAVAAALAMVAPLCLVALAADPAGPDGGRLIDEAGKTIGTRILPPPGYERAPVAAGSFEEFLRSQPLKPHGARVKYWDGREKDPAGVYCAVVDRAVRPGDIEQCADAVMRLRAEYLFARKRYSEIAFNFVSDGKPRRYVDFAGNDRSYARFLKYLDYVFARANTTSLYGQLKPVKDPAKIRIGDVFIQKHRAVNHAVMVVDLAVNPATGEKVFLMVQSYMPAQETQILINPWDDALSPWYAVRFEEIFDTPEWRFYPFKDLRRF